MGKQGKIKPVVLACIVILALALAGLGVFAVQNKSGSGVQDSTSTAQPQDTPSPAPPAKSGTSESADKDKLTSSEDGRTVSYKGEEGKTALDVLKSLAKVETKESTYGEFVTSINGVAADGTTEFWSFYVNEKLASEGAGTYQTKPTDTIEWKVEKVNQ